MSWLPLLEVAAELAFLAVDAAVCNAIFQSYSRNSDILDQLQVRLIAFSLSPTFLFVQTSPYSTFTYGIPILYEGFPVEKR